MNCFHDTSKTSKVSSRLNPPQLVSRYLSSSLLIILPGVRARSLTRPLPTYSKQPATSPPFTALSGMSPCDPVTHSTLASGVTQRTLNLSLTALSLPSSHSLHCPACP